MKPIHRKVPFLFGVFSLLTLTLIACVPRTEQIPFAGQSAVALMSQSTADCEQQLRSKMETKQLHFIQIQQLRNEINNSNIAIESTNHIRYGLSKRRQSILNLEVTHFKISEDSSHGISYKIYRQESFASEPTLALTIEFSKVTPTSEEKIQQSFQVNAACALSLAKTEYQYLLGTSGLQFTHVSKLYTSDGGSDTKFSSFTLPPQEFLANFSLNQFYPRMAIPPRGSFFLGSLLGLGKYQFESLPSSNLREFEMDLQFSHQIFRVSIQGQVFANINFAIQRGSTQDEDIGFTEIAGDRNWFVPRSVWNSVNLTEATPRVSSTLPQGYLRLRDTIRVVTDRGFTYEHFSAYWEIIDQKTDPLSGLMTYTIKENPLASASGEPATPQDLESNATIQTQLPQIQAIAREIQEKAPNDRRGQVHLILDYLKKNFSYDYGMITGNVNRQLTTAEVLERGRGVCHHYAVIFTAIARALGIPSRIVDGYYIGGSRPELHAWNEVELEPGLWRVIEPQQVQSLTSILTRFYIPIMRSKILEDRSALLDAEAYTALLSESVIQPAP